MAKDLKSILQNADAEFDLHFKTAIWHHSQDRKHKLSEILQKFQFVRKVYRSNNPMVEFLEDMRVALKVRRPCLLI